MSSRSPELILASASPRRRALLGGAGVRFAVMPSEIDEAAQPGETPRQLVVRLATDKARAVSERLGPDPRRLVLGADTIVAMGEDVLGKPRDPEHAVALLRQIVGRRHTVLTGVALLDSASGELRTHCVASEVVMRMAGDAELRAYVATGEPLDKAGAYALQGIGRQFVERVIGSESNVIGLPLEETLALLRDAGISVRP